MFKLDFLFEDEEIVVLNKPAGLVVHSGEGVKEPTLVDALIEYNPIFKQEEDTFRSGLVHRLDRMTEGLMVVAKTPHSLENLKEQFQNRTVTKYYFAWIRGCPKKTHFDIDQPIGRHGRFRYKQTVHTHIGNTAKEALTSVQVLAMYGTKSFCKIRAHTGRTHQIRVHLAHFGNPVMGDPLYSKKDEGSKTGHLLQAAYLGFDHPKTQQRMTFQLGLSERMSAII